LLGTAGRHDYNSQHRIENVLHKVDIIILCTKKRIIIENCELHKADVSQYGAYQAKKWVEQGKYNLNPAELEITNLQYELQHLNLVVLSSSFNRDKEKARIEELKRILATKNWDCRNTEAVKQWQKAHDAENKYYEMK
jgi:hypothetical protein